MHRHAGTYKQYAFATQALQGLPQTVVLGRVFVGEERDLHDRDVQWIFLRVEGLQADV